MGDGLYATIGPDGKSGMPHRGPGPARREAREASRLASGTFEVRRVVRNSGFLKLDDTLVAAYEGGQELGI